MLSDTLEISEQQHVVIQDKMRNSDHDKGLWNFAITEHGFEVQSKLERVSGLLGGARWRR